jgi:hypothetical protein
MRVMKPLMVICVLALLTMSCAHRRQGPGHPGAPCKAGPDCMAMAHGCGPESCVYKGRCFSPGAVSSNGGACQTCSGGRWVEGSGCNDCGKCCGHDGCRMMEGTKPCPGPGSGPCPYGGPHPHPHGRR